MKWYKRECTAEVILGIFIAIIFVWEIFRLLTI